MSAMDPQHFRRVLGNYPTGVAVVTAAGRNGEPLGMTVGSFGSVSLDPPLVMFMPARSSRSWAAIREADSFCVNILGDHQEQLCRRFASSGPDKFVDVPHHRTASGAPLLDGVLAYVECELHDIQPAGDHDIVLGRVRELDVVGARTPLLFFGGGYGSFTPGSRAAADITLREQLTLVDAVRPSMEELGATLGREVIAVARQGRELMFVAAAGTTVGSERMTRLGQRVPFLPPVGGVFAAWGGESALDDWCADLGTGATELDRAAVAAMVDRVRERGYVLALGHEKSARLEQLSAALPPDANAHASEELRRLIRSIGEDYNPVRQGGPVGQELHYVSAPVMDETGRAAFALTVYGPLGTCSPGEQERIVRHLLAATGSASRALKSLHAR